MRDRLRRDEQHQRQRLLQCHHPSPSTRPTITQLPHAGRPITEARACATCLCLDPQDLEPKGFQIARLPARTTPANLASIQQALHSPTAVRPGRIPELVPQQPPPGARRQQDEARKQYRAESFPRQAQSRKPANHRQSRRRRPAAIRRGGRSDHRRQPIHDANPRPPRRPALSRRARQEHHPAGTFRSLPPRTLP